MEQPGAGSGKDYGDRSSVPALHVSLPSPSEESKSSLDSMNGSEDMQSGVKGHGEGHPDIQLSGDNKNTEDQESSPSAGHGLIEGTQVAAVDVHSDQNKTPDNPAGSGKDYGDRSSVPALHVSLPSPSEESKSSLDSMNGSEDMQSGVKGHGEGHPDIQLSGDNKNTEDQESSPSGTQRTAVDVHSDQNKTPDNPGAIRSSISDANVKDGERHVDLAPSSAVDDNKSTVVQGMSVGPERSDPLFLEENEDRKEHSVSRPSTMISTNKGLYYWMIAVLVCLIAVLIYRSQSEYRVETPVKMFLQNFEKVERSFQSQPDQLWKRSRIMLQKHVNATTHSEPSILMFAAALDAETTMRCLSRSIAGAYASALGSTAVEIDGSGKNLLDSDKVKLDLDERLSSAFDKGEKAAIIHHFQDLPPPSTLLFYKYCDHENAAFKDVSLLITVLLPEERLEPDLSLNDLEEMVYDFLVVKFSVSDTPGQYNALDADKLSGLWSRLSHVILPVRPEKKIEENGCEN